MKYKSNGEVEYFKARLLAKGYKQKPYIHYLEVFGLVTRLNTIHVTISFATQCHWKIY